jgi:hypothetical protein
MIVDSITYSEYSTNESILGQGFTNLKRQELVKIPKLTSELFSYLKVITIKNCLELMEFLLSHVDGYDQDDEANLTLFPKLEEHEIWLNLNFSVEIVRTLRALAPTPLTLPLLLLVFLGLVLCAYYCTCWFMD